MIGKVIRMNRQQRRAWARRLQRFSKSIFALIRYVVDADPHSLIEQAADGILSISDYALAVQGSGIEPGEKVSAFGSRNLIGDDLAEWQAQMLAVAAGATQVEIPLVHLILSLRENESWTEAQREEAISIVLETLGLERCQVIWAEHSNTSHPHLHLAILRIDPLTNKAAGTAWLIDDLHQAMAIIEERQGRVSEPHALYVAKAGAVYDVETDALVRDVQGCYIADWYKAVGKKRTWLPAELVRKRAELIQAAAEAGSWEDLHNAFRELGASYDKAGSGARIRVGAASAKASEVHRQLSRPELEATFGEFVADAQRQDPAYGSYRESFEQQLSMLGRSREEQTAAVDERLAARVAELPASIRRSRATGMRAEAKEAKAALQAAYKESIKRCTEQRLTRDEWVQSGRPTAPREVSPPALILPSANACDADKDSPQPMERHDISGGAEYRDSEGSVLFADFRAVIIVHAVANADAIDAALKVAHRRWGTVRLNGPVQFMELAARRASVLGIEVIDRDGNSIQPARPKPISGKTASESCRQTELLCKSREPSETDGAKQVDKALDYLKAWRHLPIRRRQMPREAVRSGPYELVVVGLRDPAINGHAIYDQDSRVQAFLKTKYEELISDCEEQLLDRCSHQMLDDPKAVQEALMRPAQDHLGSSAWVAFDDADFLAMLERVRKKLRRRAKENEPGPGEEHQPQVQQQEQPAFDTELDQVMLQAAYQKAQLLQRQ